MYDTEFARLNTALTKAQTDLAAAQADNAALRSEVTALEAQVATLEQQVQDLQDQIDAGTPPVTPPPETNFLPFSVPNLQAYLDAGFGPPEYRRADSKMPNGEPAYVVWPAGAPRSWDFESQHRAMKPGQLVVLPERADPYPIDSTDGFVAVNVVSYRDTFAQAMGQPASIPINSRWHGQTGRTWWAMTRMRRGIIGLGPGAAVEPTDSGFTRFPQSPNSRYSAFYTNGQGAEQKITGNQEKLIDHSDNDTLDGVRLTGVNKNPYVGNFTMRGRNFGSYDISPEGDPAQTNVGVAYHGIIANGMTMENMHFDSCWRGHGYSPNCETGAFAVGGFHNVRNITINGANAGRTTLVMSNGVTDAAVLENVRVLNPRGGIVRWNCSGKHVWRNVLIPAGGNINIEDNQAGYTLEWIGGTIGGGTFNINLRSPRGSTKIILRDVKPVGAVQVLTVNVWANGTEPRTQKASDITAFDAAGNPVTVKVQGSVAA